jgi:integrase
VTEGLDWAASLKEECPEGPDDPTPVADALSGRLDEVERAEGESRAGMLAAVAYGKATPIGPLADQWLAEKPLRAKQKLDYRRAVRKLKSWLTEKALAPTLQAVTKQTASAYRDEAFVRAGVHSRSANKDLSALSGLWKHAERKDMVVGNPWRGQFLPQSDPTSAQKRPFTDPEVTRLLTSLDPSRSPMQALLRDTVQVLALSGLRVEEWASMKVADLRDLDGALPYVALRGTKTAASRRDVPLHPDMLPIVRRRVTLAGPDGFLVGELNTPPEGSAWGRGQPITKEFGRVRKRLGIDEREPGARQANVDLHSLRRWFISRARDALNGGAQGFSMRTVAEVVGHEKGELGLSMTSRYAHQEPMSAKMACVRSVRLPSGD